MPVEGGGDASLVEARLAEGLNDEQVREMIRAARDADYQAVAEEARQAARGLPRKGEMSEEKRADGVYKATWGRTTREHGRTLGNTMGVNTWAALAGSDDKAVIDGDFALLESVLQDVLKALRHAGINIVAIHSHMSGEQSGILFLHSRGLGPAEQPAKGVMAALEETKTGT